MSVDEALRKELAVEQRRANLGEGGIPSLEALDRRRHQIATVGVIVAIGMLVVVLVATNVIALGSNRWIDGNLARFATIGFGVAMVLYAFDQERHLRRVERHRGELVALDCGIASDLLTAGIVLDSVCALHASIELGTVIPTIVDQGCGLLGAERAVLFLADEDHQMEVVQDADGHAAMSMPTAELVMNRESVVAVTGAVGTDIGVPIAADGTVLGVLVLPGVLTDRLTDDLRTVLTRFGTEAAQALANARRYEAAVFLLDVTPV